MKHYHWFVLFLINKRDIYSFTVGVRNHNVIHVIRSRESESDLVDQRTPLFLNRRTVFRSSVSTENDLVSSDSLRSRRTKKINQLQRIGVNQNVLLAFTGVSVALSLLYSIAMVGENTSITSLQDLTERLQQAYQHLYDAIAPLGISDIMSVIAGESTAAAVAAAASSFILLCIKVNQKLPELAAKVKSRVVADGDFLVAKAVSLSLLGSIGFSPALTQLLSSLFASFPYGILKLGVQRREQIMQEDRVMDALLTEQLKKEENERIQAGLLQTFTVWDEDNTVGRIADVSSLKPIESNAENRLDFVDVFSDIVKWLQYDVFMTHFGDTLTWNGQALIPGLEAAIFGAVACTSAQLYCDILYAIFDLGGVSKREEVCNRSSAEWFSLYVTQTLYGVALFLTYEACQIPAQWMLNAFLSGGVDNCIGAIDYSGCIETFIELNPPQESPEEELYERIAPVLESFQQMLTSNVERP